MAVFLKRVALVPPLERGLLHLCVCVCLSLSLSTTCIFIASGCKERTSSVPGPKTHHITRKCFVNY